MRFAPLRTLRPSPGSAARVASPPYDVVTADEARTLAAGNPWSFLRVCRSEIDLPPDTDPHDPAVYARAHQNLQWLQAEGALVLEDQPAIYLYRLGMGGRAQVGVAGGVHVDDYEHDVIRKHETTRPDKEDDRTRHVLALRAHAEPVILAYRDVEALRRRAAAEQERAPLLDVTARDGVRHTLWRLADPRPWVEAFAEVPTAYVADGHHRSASAWRAAAELRTGDFPARSGEFEWFPGVLFPAGELRILPYNRIVRDLGGQRAAAVLDRLGRVGRLAETLEPTPPGPGAFCLYLSGCWRRLELDPASIDAGDPIRSLDVSLLHERVLAPILGIGDQRTDPRIDFVGGIRGVAELARRVDAGEAALAVSMCPTTVQQLMAAA